MLQSTPGVLHVMLLGPRDARIRQGMEVDGVDPLDRTRYHLILDSTAIDLDTCVDIIVAASQARMRKVHPARPS